MKLVTFTCEAPYFRAVSALFFGWVLGEHKVILKIPFSHYELVSSPLPPKKASVVFVYGCSVDC